MLVMAAELVKELAMQLEVSLELRWVVVLGSMMVVL